MKVLKSLLYFAFIISITLLAFSPFLILNISLPEEAWLLSAAREMREAFSLIPRLDGVRLGAQNPIVIMLYSLAGGDVYISRLATILLGVIMTGSVMMFTRYMWGVKAGALAAILTATSLGTVSLFGQVNGSALPVMACAAAFMLFSAVYLRKLSGKLYFLAYILAAVSVLTGGTAYFFFFVLSAVLLVLLDLSPGELLKIKPVAAIAFLVGSIAAFYAVYRIGGGKAYVSGIMSPGADIGFFKSIWLAIKNSLPWFLLLVPAWAGSARPSDFDSWREMLPPKIAILSCFLVTWLSGRCPQEFSTVSVPFISIIIAKWASEYHKVTDKKDYIEKAAMLFTVLAVFVMPVAFVLKFPIRSLHPGIADGIIALCLLAVITCLMVAAIKRRHRAVMTIAAAAVVLMCWLRPFYEARLNNPEVIIAQCSNVKPLFVYEDDLVMRGKLADSYPTVVPRCFMPVGEVAYLAASTGNGDKLMNELKKKMFAEIKSSENLDRDYLLIEIQPSF